MGEPLLVGRTLGEFVVREKIGSGGQGLVFRAEQPALAREAVIKVMHTRTPAGPETTQRFLREARLASRLDHPYAAHVYAFGAEPDGLLWIAMERVRGTPLDKLLRAQGPIPPVRLVPFLEKLCEVVHSAHELGIVHRDIKPGNVMVLARAGRLLPKLLDFGLAKLHDLPELLPDGSLEIEVTADTMGASPPVAGSVTGHGVMLGSPSYMAPEQWSDAGAATGRSDIYALGILTYETLVGRVPFAARSVLELSKAHATQAPPPLGGELPAALDEVLARAMAKKPEDRYPSAVDLAAALRRAAGVHDRDPLPRLDDGARSAVQADAPQPLADAIAALDGAHSVHQARDALWAAVRVAARLLGVTALAVRVQLGGAEGVPEEELRELRRKGLDDPGWIALGRGLLGRADLHPIPELVEVLGAPVLDELLAEKRAVGDAPSEAQVAAHLVRCLPLLGRLLDKLAPLWAYTWVVPRGELGAAWMGLSRPRRPTVMVQGAGLVDGELGLIDARGVPVARLHPFAQAAAPAPGGSERLFLVDGPGRRGARLVALPEGFERDDDELWDALRHILEVTDDERTGAAREESPFPGLSAFTREDADRFVGREREVEAFRNRLRQQPLLAVVGPSGAGKSSFVRAGVLPGMEGSVIVLRPGHAPLASLASAVRAAGIEPGEDVPTALRALGRPVCLVVDQLEELFTLCPDPAEREAFARVLSGCARSPDEPVRVIMTMRDDFLMRAERLAAFRERLTPALFLLQTPARPDLVRILREPTRRVGYEWDDPHLVDEMVDAVASEPGALALISFTASRLWERRDRHFKQLRRRAYDALGGVGGALAQHAEETLASLPPEERGLVREAFRRLVTVDGTRAVVDRDELPAGGVVEKLIEARLLTASEGGDGREHVEVVHEALLSAWPRLETWRREDNEGARLGEQLRAAARQWDARGRPGGLLWRDDALAELRLWARRFPDRLSGVEQSFAEASRAAAARAFRVRIALVGAAFAALVAGIVVLLRVNAEVAAQRTRAGALASEREQGLVRQFLDQGRRAMLNDDPQLALAYLAEAQRRGAGGPALAFLAAQAVRATDGELAVLLHGNMVTAAQLVGDRLVTANLEDGVRAWDAGTGVLVAAMPHARGATCAAAAGDHIASGGRDGEIRLWEARSGRLRHDGRIGGYVHAAELSTRHAAFASGNGRVHVVELATARRVHELEGHSGGAFALTFTPDEKRLVSAGRDGTARVWDLGTGKLVETLAGHEGPVVSVAISPAGLVATGSADGTARLWGTRPFTLAHEGDVASVAFDPEGKRLLTASSDKTARVWDAATGEPLVRIAGHKSRLNRARFSADGRTVVTASDDTTVAAWDAENGRPLARLYTHSDLVADVTWAGRDRVVTAGRDGRAVIWQVVARQPILALRHAQAVNFARFDPTARRVVTTSMDGKTRLWDAADARLLHELTGDSAPIRAAFSGDGSRLATAEMGGTVALWDAATGARLGASKAHGGVAMVVAFGARDTLLASGGGDRAVKLWRPQPLELVGTLDFGGFVNAVSFHPDGTHLLVAGNGAPAQIFDVAARTRLATWELTPISTVGYMENGSLVIGAGADHSVRVVSFPEGRQVAEWRGHLGVVTDAEERGGIVATSSEDESVRIWDARSGDLLAVLLGHQGAVRSAQFGRDTHTLLTAGEDGQAWIWSLPPAVPSADVARAARCRTPYQFEGDVVKRVLTAPCL